MVVAEVSPPARPGHHNGTAEEESATQRLLNQGGTPTSAKLPSAAAGSHASGGGSPLRAQRGGDAAPSGAWHWLVMAHFTGAGDVTTTTFRVRPQEKLRLRWTFRCAAGTRAGTFGIQDLTAITTSVDGSLEETGTAGRGTTVVYPGGAADFLVVTSSCSWAVKAVQRS